MPKDVPAAFRDRSLGAEPLRSLRPEAWLFVALLLPVLLAYAITVGNDAVVVAVTTAIVAIATILARPYWGLLLFLILVYVRPADSIPSLANVQLALAVSVATLAGVWLQLHLNRERAVKHPVIISMLGFWLACIASTASGGNPVDAALNVGKLLIMVWLILNLVRTPARYRHFEASLILLTLYVAGVVIYRDATGQVLHLSEGDRAAGTGVIGDPNDSAAVIAAGLALTLNAALNARGLWRWLCWPTAGAMIWAIYLTQSRGGMLALMVAVGGTLYVRSRRRVLGLALGGLAAFGLLAATGGRMTNFDSHEASANSRIEFWNNGVGLLLNHPVLGVGSGQFAANNGGRAPHGSFVQAFAETGMVGYFCWLGVLYWAFRRRQGAAGEDAAGMGGWLAPQMALAAYLTAAFYLTHAYMTFLYIFACLAVAQQLAHASAEPGAAAPERWTLRDAGRIAALAVASPLLIKVIVWRLG